MAFGKAEQKSLDDQLAEIDGNPAATDAQKANARKARKKIAEFKGQPAKAVPILLIVSLLSLLPTLLPLLKDFDLGAFIKSIFNRHPAV